MHLMLPSSGHDLQKVLSIRGEVITLRYTVR